MITLGLNAAFNDSAAALVIDGVPVAAVEEERFTRVKHAKRPLPFSAWELPFHAVESCLEQAGLTLAQVDHVAYSFDPARFAAGRDDLDNVGGTSVALPLVPGAPSHAGQTGIRGSSAWDPLLLAYAVNAARQLAEGAPHALRRCRIERAGAGADALPWRWHHVEHPLCHQASAFLAAPFDSCAVLTIDSRGECAATAYGVYRGGRYRRLGEVPQAHSLGLLYERVTAHLGFEAAADEHKVMALAALAPPLWVDALCDAIRLLPHGRFEIDPIDLNALAGAPRTPGAALEPRHLQLAASMQQALERKVLGLAEWLREASGERRLAMAGTLALNCALSTRLRDKGPFEAIWVPPAAGDAGTALGAALWVDGRRRVNPDARARADIDAPLPLAPRRWRMEHAFLGPAWSDGQTQQLLAASGLEYLHIADEHELIEHCAALLVAGCLLGWHQGRMEWGPHALGARSILASPIDPKTKPRLDALKDREDLLPLASAVPAEAFADWFTPPQPHGGGSPFGLFTQRVRQAQAALIPSACHHDGSARVQTVEAAHHPRFHALLQAFGRLTGVPVLVNASFRVRGQPIVCSPEHALEAFFTTPLDALVIGSFVLRKPASALQGSGHLGG